MNKRIAAIWLSLTIVLGFILIIVEIAPVVKGSKIIYVDDVPGVGPGNPAENYTSIQAAIDNASDGDTVFVYNGTYYEHVVVYKTIDLIGEDRNNTKIDGGWVGDVVLVTADQVKVAGFTITGGGGNPLEDAGIELHDAYNCRIYDNDFSRNSFYGIFLRESNNNNIFDNNASSNNYAGICLYGSNMNIITGNIVYSNTMTGIELKGSSENNISGNHIIKNEIGIMLHGSNDNEISDNIGSNKMWGIIFSQSTGNYLTNNTMIDDGIVITGDLLEHWTTHFIDTSNTVYSKPVYYWKNKNGGIVPSGAGQIILANCKNVKIENQELINGSLGIELGFSSNNNITGNSIRSNKADGILLYRSAGNDIVGNNASNNEIGILIVESKGNNITGNNISSNNYDGIFLVYSESNNITSNNVFSNHWFGIDLEFSSRNNISGNTVSFNNRNGLNIFDHSNNNIIRGNIIASNNWEGISLFLSEGNNIVGNNVLNNWVGIYIISSDGNNITGNTVSSNKYNGIWLDYSANNRIFHNIIIDNKDQATDNRDDNYWDNGYPSGGNYWSNFDEPSEGAYDDYHGPDQNMFGNDGIVDNGTFAGGGKNPYVIDSDSQDNYPLIQPIGNYLFLYEGWNLISIPFVQLDSNLESVFSSISGAYDAVQWYNVSDNSDYWKHNSTKKPSHLNDLNSIDHIMGFWIHVTEPGGILFEYHGIPPFENRNITLHPGWNLVGYPSLTRNNRTEGLNNIVFGSDVNSIWTYNAATQKWKEIGNSDSFEIGRGYWIHSKVKKVWNVPL